MPDFKPFNPDWAEKVRDIFSSQGYMTYLGITLTGLDPGHVEMVVPYRPELGQQAGYFHGGLVGALVDNSGGCAAATLMAADMDVLAVEYKVNLLRPAVGDELVVRAGVTKPGRTLCFCQCEIFSVANGIETLCATGAGTYMFVPDPGGRRGSGMYL